MKGDNAGNTPRDAQHDSVAEVDVCEDSIHLSKRHADDVGAVHLANTGT
jgi:hypothetical protein